MFPAVHILNYTNFYSGNCEYVYQVYYSIGCIDISGVIISGT